MVDESRFDPIDNDCNGPGKGIQYAYEAPVNITQEQLTENLTVTQTYTYLHSCFSKTYNSIFFGFNIFSQRNFLEYGK